MFLSTENPPNDPLSSSSSSHFLHLTTSSHELGQSHLPSFFIRDYAYAYGRKNSIKSNWPFSKKTLQLLKTHGVTDPLPPFQKYSIVSNQFEMLEKQIVSYVHRGRDFAKLGLNQTLAQTSKGVCNQSRIIENGLFPSTSVSKSEVELVVAATSNKDSNHSKKRGRMMVKSNEDSFGVRLVTTSESVLASKTCPICKTFSSASNTTLNAHIDQCLSVDLPSVVSSKPNKPVRSKRRVKEKSMLDIYASAKESTLEDLDKRNGTNWVSILSYTNQVVPDKSEVSKMRKVSPVGVGPVYIDAEGQKLRILSEFSQKKASSTLSRKQHEHDSGENKCLSQGSKVNNKCSRKNRRGKKPQKYVKLTNHKSKVSEKMPEYERRFSGEGSSKKGHRRIYNQRMLAKRRLISKKLNEKGQKFYSLQDQPSEEDDDDTWSGGDTIVSRGTDLSGRYSYPLNKHKLGSEVRKNEKGEVSPEGVYRNTLRLRKSTASIQKDKFPPEKNFRSDALEVSDASPRATSMKKLSPPSVPNAWRQLYMTVELTKARLDLSEEENEEETGKWESEMTQERELPDKDYVSSDSGEKNEVLWRSNTSSSGYDDNDDDEESSEENEDNNKRAHALDQTDDADAELYFSDSPPSVEILPSNQAMHYSKEVGNMINGQTSCKEDVRFYSEAGKGSLSVEVDTIPIPGPPGSFLPSPRDMGFDENLGNSSVVTSQVQSSMDQLDRNSSESPVSAVSNFATGRLNFPTDLSSFRENFSQDIPVSYSITPMSFCVPSHHGTIAEAEPNTIYKKTAPSSFINNEQDESCCCQRKESISTGSTLNHQASHLLQRRAASSSVATNLTQSPIRLEPNHPFEQSPSKIQQDLDPQSQFSSRTNLNRLVPPSPNPVLRLMGKDLMVMSQGEANEEASLSSLTPTPQCLDPPCTGTRLYFNTGLSLRNSFELTHQPQTQAQAQPQASSFKSNFDHVRYFSPS